MAITEEQNTELTNILSDIQGEEGMLTDRERTFVSDQVERHDKYGLNIYMSEKQWSWLRSIHGKVAGR